MIAAKRKWTPASILPDRAPLKVHWPSHAVYLHAPTVTVTDWKADERKARKAEQNRKRNREHYKRRSGKDKKFILNVEGDAALIDMLEKRNFLRDDKTVEQALKTMLDVIKRSS